MIINRIGDVGLAFALFSLFSICGTLDYSVVFACVSHLSSCSFCFCQFEFDALCSIGVFLLIGACGKSAQFGLHT